MNAFKLDYDYIQNVGIENSFKEFLKDNASKIFFHKTFDWQDENEFRLIVLNSLDEYLYVAIDESLKGIVVGSKFPMIYYPIFHNLQETKGIKFGRIQWFNGIPVAVDQTPVDNNNP